MNTLGNRIKYIRGKESQESFAAKIGVSKGSLGGYERDENSPSADAILKICSTANISAEWLLTGQGQIWVDRQTIPLTALKLTGEPPAQKAIASCAKCLELYERLLQASERERILLKEIAELKSENILLKTTTRRQEGPTTDAPGSAPSAQYQGQTSNGDLR